MKVADVGARSLDGIVVADFSRILAGPYATMMMGDLGADVIKVERLGVGDDTRQWGPPYDADGAATYFNGVNRNKRSVWLDLRTLKDQRRAHDLILSADVVIENFRSGTMNEFGLGYEQFNASHPGLIYCSITGFGSGQGADLPGYDLLIQAMGGLMSITGADPDAPMKVGVAVVDVLAALHALTGILASLVYRSRTGEGQRVEVNLLSALLSSLVNQASGYLGAGVIPRPLGNSHPSIAPYQVVPTADRPLAIAVGNDGQFARMAEALGVPELAYDARFATNQDRVRHRDTLTAILENRFQQRSAGAWADLLTSVAVPAGPINDVSQAFDFARRIGLEPIVRTPGAASAQVANPIGLSKTPVTYRLDPPLMEDNSSNQGRRRR